MNSEQFRFLTELLEALKESDMRGAGIAGGVKTLLDAHSMQLTDEQKKTLDRIP